MDIKGMSIPMHDYRAWWGYGLQYAVRSGGPINEGGWDYAVALERVGKIRPFTTERRGELVKKGQETRTFLNCLGICTQAGMLAPIERFFEMEYRALSALTGWDVDEQEARRVGLRVINLRRVFNLRHGLEPEDDMMPPRLLEAPTGPARGHAPKIKQMVHDYYKALGWDEKTGKPLRRTLKELDLEDLIEVIWK